MEKLISTDGKSQKRDVQKETMEKDIDSLHKRINTLKNKQDHDMGDILTRIDSILVEVDKAIEEARKELDESKSQKQKKG